MPEHRSKYDAPEYEATGGGTWPDGTDFAAGDTIAGDRFPEADKHRLIQRGVFVPRWPDEREEATGHDIPVVEEPPGAESEPEEGATDAAE